MQVAIVHISSVLSMFVGPMGDILCGEYFDKKGKFTSYHDLKDMIDDLSLEILNGEERNDFKIRAMKLVKG